SLQIAFSREPYSSLLSVLLPPPPHAAADRTSASTATRDALRMAASILRCPRWTPGSPSPAVARFASTATARFRRSRCGGFSTQAGSPAAPRTGSPGASWSSRTPARASSSRTRSTSRRTSGARSSWWRSSARGAWTPAAACRTCCSSPGTRGSAPAPTGSATPKGRVPRSGSQRTTAWRSCSPSGTPRDRATPTGGRPRTGAPGPTASRSTASSRRSSRPLAGGEHELAEVLARLHPVVRRFGFGERADAVDHRVPRPLVDHAQQPGEVAGGAHRRPQDRLPAEVEGANVERHLGAAGSAEDDQPATPSQSCEGLAPGRADRVEDEVDGPGRLRPALLGVQDAALGAELLCPVYLLLGRRGDQHPRTRLRRELNRERRHAAARAEHEHCLAPLEPPDREQGAPGGQPGERKRRRLLPREPSRLREDVLRGHLDELRVRPVGRPAEDLPLRPRCVL